MTCKCKKIKNGIRFLKKNDMKNKATFVSK